MTQSESQWSNWIPAGPRAVAYVPHAAGVYALLRNNTIVYYGSATDLAARLACHNGRCDGNPGQPVDAFCYRTCYYYKTEEQNLIDGHVRQYGSKPQYNQINALAR